MIYLPPPPAPPQLTKNPERSYNSGISHDIPENNISGIVDMPQAAYEDYVKKPGSKIVMSQADRLERRKAIAAHVDKHGDYAKAAAKFSVSIPTVQQAFNSFGKHKAKVKKKIAQAKATTKTQRKKRVDATTDYVVYILTELMKGEKSMAEIGEKYGVSRQWVSVIKGNAVKTGFFKAAKKYKG